MSDDNHQPGPESAKIPTSDVTMNMCIHEAGHVVVGCLLGLHVHGVIRTKDGLGVPACGTEHPTKLESKTLAIWSMGGAAAERIAECFDPDGCISDFDEACFHIKDHLDDQELSVSRLVAGVKNAEVIAQALLNSSWASVLAVAVATLDAGGDLSEDALGDALRSSNVDRDLTPAQKGADDNDINAWLEGLRLPHTDLATPEDLDTIARALAYDVGLKGPGVGDPRLALIQALWLLRCERANFQAAWAQR